MRATLLFTLVLTCCLLETSLSFALGRTSQCSSSPTTSTISISTGTTTTTSQLFAVKPTKNKNKGKNINKSSSGGGGFGAPATSSASNNNNAKVRAVSGYKGSGTKPLRNAANTFDTLRKDYGEDACYDVYVRSPLNDASTFWFVGKVALCTDMDKLVIGGTNNGGGDAAKTILPPTPHDAVISQKRLILEYAKHELRPQNMGGPFSEGLELWVAERSGDREMDAVQNKVSLEHVTGSLASLSEGFHVANVGYNPEIYVGDEVTKGGLRIIRDDEGKPVKPVFDINESM